MRSIHLWPLLLAPLLGCELVADIHDRSVFDDPTAGQGGAGAGGQPTGHGGAGTGGAGTGGASAGVAGTGGVSAGQAGSEPRAGAGAGGASGAGSDQGGAGLGGQPAGPGGEGGAGAGQAGAGAQAGAGSGGAGASGAGSGQGGVGLGGEGGAGQAGDAGMSGISGQGGTAPTCTIPFTTGTGTGLRVANLVPASSRYDVCIKSASDADFSQVTPLLHGPGCPNGLAYKQVSASLDLAPGLYDVKFIASTGADCGGAGVGTSAGAVVKSGSVTDVFLAGSASDFAPQIFSESVPQSLNNTALRLVHAARGVGSVDLVFADATEPPAAPIGPALFKQVTYLQPPTQSPLAQGSVDANGYVQVASPGPINLGIADDNTGASGAGGSAGAAGSSGASGVGGSAGPGGATAADGSLVRLVRPTVFTTNQALTMFLVGTSDEVSFPQQTVLCDDFGPDDQAPYLARCNEGLGSVQPARFGTFNTQLVGVFAPYEPPRRPAVIAAAVASASDLDVLCLGETWSAADRSAIVEAAKDVFPHAVNLGSDESTPIEDPTDQEGNVPAPYPTPACVDSGQSNLESLIGCLKAKCADGGSSSDDFEGAKTRWGSCASSSTGCQVPFGSLLSTPSCFSCALVQTQSYQTMSDIRANCTDPAKKDRRFTFRGNNGALLLSKWPVVSSELIMLPATEWRVGVVRAAVKTPNNALVDVYCTTLTTPADAFTRPYAGQYGDGQSLAKAWDAENKLQNEKLATLVHERSRYRRAVVLGELYTGPAYQSGSTKVLDAYTPDSWQVVLANFGLAVAPGYVPACTECASNPLVGGTRNVWASHALLFNAAVSDVRATSIGLTDATVAVTDDKGQALLVPVSSHYSLRTTVNIDP